MNKYEATELGIRLIAVFNLTTIVSDLPALMAVLDLSIIRNSGFPPYPWFLGFFSIVMPVLISLFLWFRANAISNWIWRNRQTIETEPSPTASQIQIVLFTAIGFYFLLSSVPEVLKFGVHVGQQLAWNSYVGLYDYAFVAGYTLQMLLAIWLILGSNAIVKALQVRPKSHSK